LTSGGPVSNTAITATGDTQTLTIYASAASSAAQTVNLNLTGNASEFGITYDDEILNFSNGSYVLDIPAGQSSLTLTLNYLGNATTAQTVQLTSTLGSDSAVSNTLAVTFAGTPAPATSKVITGVTGTLPNFPSATSPIVPATVYLLDGNNDSVTAGAGSNIIAGSVQGAGTDGTQLNNDFAIVAGDNPPWNNVFNGEAYTGAAGNNTIAGGGGQDIILVGDGNNQIYAGSVVPLGTAISQAQSESASNTVGDYIAVGDGNNTIVGGTGNDYIDVGEGNNTIVCGPGTNSVDGGMEITGNYLNFSATNPFVSGGPFNALPPTGYEGATYNVLGVDYLVGTGNDTIYGGTGDSQYDLPNGNNYVDAGGGNDTIWASTGNNTIFGGSGNDTILGGGGNDYIDGESGSDHIVGEGGNTTIYGGTGNDTILSGDNNDTWATSITTNNTYIDAGSGNSILYGAGGDDTLMGGSGNDSLYAGAGTEYLQAGDGANSLVGGAGDDTLIGGDGNDTIVGGSGNDYLEAGDGNTTIFGGAGNETIVGGNGNDSINAGSGDETITGGNGVNVIWGGAGNDSITAGDGGSDASRAQITAGSGDTTIVGGAGVDYIQGGSGNDVLFAGDGGDADVPTEVIAGSGNTTITGGSGIDALLAGSGNDSINAGDGGTADNATSLEGGSGNATLVAGAGTDYLFGNSGTTTYQINSGSGTVSIFNSGAGDVLEFGAGISIADITAVPVDFSNGPTGVQLTLNGGGTVTIENGGLTQATFGDGTVATFAQLLSPSFTIGNTTYASVSGALPQVATSLQADTQRASAGAQTTNTGFQLRDGAQVRQMASSTAPAQYLTLTGSADLSGAGNNINDVITANAGNDTLIAGTADDTLVGGGASDNYVVSAGTGTITTIKGSTGTDTLSFASGVTLADLSVSTAAATGGGIIVTLQNSQGGSVVISSDTSGTIILDQISFADGSTASLGALLAPLTTGATAATSAGHVTLAGGIQNMTLTGTASITATGNAQDDVITANSGNDTLIAGTNYDTLVGGSGATTYDVTAGSNVAITNSGSADTLAFGAGIAESDLTTTSANGVTTIIDDQGGTITIQGNLNQVSFASGDTATLTQLLAPSYTKGTTTFSTVDATAGAGIVALTMAGDGNVTATANGLNDTIQSNSGNDTLTAGTGNDTLIGYGGTNTYVIATGAQTTTIEQSSLYDTLSFGSGVTLADLSATAALDANGNTDITLKNSLGGTVVIDASTSGPLDQIDVANGSTASLGAILAQATTGITAATSAGNVTLAGHIQNMALTGSASISATGNSLDDVITANSGNDTLIAGAADDTLVGGSGKTTYEVTAGNNVAITNSSSGDTLVFGAGITESDLTATSVNGVTTIVDDQGGTITIQGSLNQINFASGDTATLTELLAPDYTVGANEYSQVSTTAGSGITNLVMTGNANVTATANGGNDTIQSNSGNDILVAGSGNDTLIGGYGNTTYEVGTTSGAATIKNGGSGDSIGFGTGVTAVDLSATAAIASDGSATVTIHDSVGNSITIDDYAGGMVDQIGFAGGATESLSILLAQATTGSTAATSATSVMLGNGIQNMILTGSASVTATGNGLDDIITANSGNDALVAGSGNDTLVAGAGNDTLTGCGGTTTYELSASATGTTTITQSASTDILSFAPSIGIDANDFSVTGTFGASGLTAVTIKGYGGTTIIEAGSNGQMLNQLEYSNGTIVSLSNLLAQSTSGPTAMSSATSVNPMPAGILNLTLTGSANLSATGNNLNDVINANSGNDVLTAGTGNDTLVAGSGSDTLVAGAGNDVLMAGSGSDTLTGGAGNTTYEPSLYGTYTITQSSAGDTLAFPEYALNGNFSPTTLGQLFPSVSLGANGDEVVTIEDDNSGSLTNGTVVVDAGANGQMLGNVSFYADENGTYVPVTITMGQLIAQATTGITAMTSATSVSVLPTGIQNLILTGTGNLSATANTLDDVITGNGGNDTLTAGSGTDTLNSGTGNDTFVGADGDTTYKWSDAQTTTIDQSASSDTLDLNGIALANLVGSTSNVDGVTVTTITAGGSNSVVIDGGALTNVSYDGGTISLAELTAPTFIVGNTMYSQVDATLPANGAQNLILTGSANISGTGNAGSDTITGNSGADTLIGGAGVDSLVGGTGNDTMISGTGGGTFTNTWGRQGTVDTYVVNAGDGNVTINNSGSNDILQFGAGITASDLTITDNGELTYGEGTPTPVTISDSQGGSVTIELGSTPALNQIEFAGGATTTLSQLLAANPANVISMTASSATTAASVVEITTTASNILAYGNSLDDTLTAASSNDTLYAGTGEDTLVAATGSSGTTLNGYFSGNATFLVDANSGTTTINFNAGDEIAFGSGITAADVSATTSDASGSWQWVLTTTQGATVDINPNSASVNLDAATVTFAGGATLTFDQLLAPPVISGSTMTAQGSETLPSGLSNLDFIGDTNITGTINSANATITGNAGNDTLIAGGNNDTINGGTGNDTLTANGNNAVVNVQNYSDVVAANGNQDVINFLQSSSSGTIAATVVGGGGNTTYSFADNLPDYLKATILNSSSSDVLDLPEAVNPTQIVASTKVVGGVTEDVLTWNSAFSAYWTGATASVTIVGGGGQQQLLWTNGTGGPTLFDYTFNQLLALGEPVYSSQSAILAAGVTSFGLTGENSSATANNLNDFIAIDSTIGSSSPPYNDTLISGAGNDTLDGSGGSQDVYLVNQGSGTTTIMQSNNDTLEFGAGITAADVTGVESSQNGMSVYTLQVAGGNSVILDNPSLQSVYFTDGGTSTNLAALSVFTSSTNDTLPSGATRLVLTGSGNISGTGNNLADTITANSGNDTLIAGSGVATLIGGSGNDTFVINNASDVIIEAANSGNNTEQTSVSATIGANVENLIGTGTTALTLTGGATADTITANNSADTLIAGSGVATLVGGSGNDTFEINSASDVITKAVNSGSNTEQSSVSTTLAANVQNLTGTGTANITLTGNSLANKITANTGADTLIAGTGVATLVGGTGNDTFVIDSASDVITKAANTGSNTEQTSVSATIAANVQNLAGIGSANLTLTGGTTADTITANSGADTLVAGSGVATLIGGAGNDTFVIDNVGDVVTETANAGSNTEQTSVSATIGANVQNLTGTGTAALTLTGGATADTITANNSADTLIAGSGVATLVGGSGNDTFEINNASDVITEAANSGNNTEQSSVSTTLAANVQNLTGSGTGNITLTGNSLANKITANSGADTLVAGTGVATLVGGTGNDTFVIDSASDVITKAANTGSNTEQTSVSATIAANLQNLTGIGTANLTLTGGSTADTITANSGADTLVAGTGVATLVGGTGNDTFTINNASDVITEAANSGNNIEQTSVTITLAANVQNLTGTSTGSISLTGNTLADTITANSGADTLVSGTGIDTLVGGSGNDTFVVNNSSDAITVTTAKAGNVVQSTVNYVLPANLLSLTGTSTGAISLTGNTLADTITANSGNDTLVSGTGIDTLVGGAGNDTFVVNNSSDAITVTAAKAGNVVQSNVNYVLPTNLLNLTGTGTAAISLTGNASVDTITANSGNDTLTAGSGLATLIGGTGNDTFVIDNASDVITEAANTGNNTEQTSVTATLAANVQNLTATGTTAVTLTGNTLNDVITANSAADKLVAGAGNDTLVSGTGIDTLTGGAGNDTFNVNNASDVVTASAGTNVNTISSSVSYTASTNVQDLFLTGTAAITGTGNSGNDLLIAGSGTDTLVGGSGTSVLEAGSGNDTLKDTAAANALIGGAGNDTMTGGTGADFIAGGAGNDAITLGAGTAVVAFNTGDGKATIAVGSGVSNVLSLGGGISYANLSFSKSGNNLILNTGGNNSITFTNWYSGTADQNFVTLQVIEQAASTYSSSSTNVLYNEDVEDFSFSQLVSAFNTALAANPSMTSWSLSNALLTAHLSGSNTAALGGDLAYYDGLNGNLTGMNLATAVSTLQNATYGKTAQTIDAWSGISAGSNRLH
jgi:Ca2+-binding RTX toxin-like protein